MRSRELGRRAAPCLALAVALVLGACGAGTTATATNDNRARDAVQRGARDEHDDVADERDERRDREGDSRARAACPSRFGEHGPTCTDGDVPVSCGYPEGTCGCETGTWCGGAYPPPMPLTWRCRAHASPCAAAGTPCSEPGSSCHLDECGFHGVRCVGGVWESYMTPPPP